MPHVVTDNCQSCRYTECVSVCPVECFHQGEEMLYIDPDVCIDCGGCIPACPVNAIYDDYSIPDNMNKWIEVNQEKSKELPVLTERLGPLDSAEKRRTELGLNK